METAKMIISVFTIAVFSRLVPIEFIQVMIYGMVFYLTMHVVLDGDTEKK